MRIADRVKQIKDVISEAALKTGRQPEEISLVAASKTMSVENIREAILAGVDAVGENRVQEMLEKNAAGAYHGIPLHFIGHLQKNKIRHVVGLCNLIQSAGSKQLITQIGRRAAERGLNQDILIEVNVGKESSKSGVMPEEAEETVVFAQSVPGICVKGLMAIPPIAQNGTENRRYFEEMYRLYVDIKQKKYDNVHMNILSLGMSNDFQDAVLSGANMVRIGSAIFGRRVY
ncbi:MAG: YggS family pyridoxal phosphate-dependent enzyme [Clostridiales bacterium]|nr:YggS family pyridoxal phosphate-dependent enzyme [Clostridiales bacterium]